MLGGGGGGGGEGCFYPNIVAGVKRPTVGGAFPFNHIFRAFLPHKEKRWVLKSRITCNGFVRTAR